MLIYEEHFDLAWRTARRLGVPESAAGDVVQDTFLVLHRRLEDERRSGASLSLPPPSAEVEQAEAVRLLEALRSNSAPIVLPVPRIDELWHDAFAVME